MTQLKEPDKELVFKIKNSEFYKRMLDGLWEMKIKIFVTGGTIDGLDYNSKEKSPKKFNSSIPKILEQARLGLDYNIEILFFKDSKFITDKDREIILEKCKNCKENKIIITHGTITMAFTAKFLGKHELKKKIQILNLILDLQLQQSNCCQTECMLQ